MPERKDREQRARNLFRTELARQGATYAQPTEKLTNIGVADTEWNVRNMVRRGKYTVDFVLQCMKAIGVKNVRLN